MLSACICMQRSGNGEKLLNIRSTVQFLISAYIHVLYHRERNSTGQRVWTKEKLLCAHRTTAAELQHQRCNGMQHFFCVELYQHGCIVCSFPLNIWQTVNVVDNPTAHHQMYGRTIWGQQIMHGLWLFSINFQFERQLNCRDICCMRIPYTWSIYTTR